MQYTVKHDGKAEICSSESAAQDVIVDYALSGVDCTLVYPEDYSDCGCPPDEYYPALDVAKIVSYVGKDAFDALLEASHSYGYGWFRNIEAGDADCIAESINACE